MTCSVLRWKETYVLAIQNLSQQPEIEPEIVSMDAQRQKPILVKTDIILPQAAAI